MIEINVKQLLQPKSQVKVLPKIVVMSEDPDPEHRGISHSWSTVDEAADVLDNLDPVEPDPAPPVHQVHPKDQVLKELWEQLGTIKRERGKISSTIYEEVYGRKLKKAIDIGTVLNKIDATVDLDNNVRTFGLRFLSGHGVSELINCRKNVKNPKTPIGEHEERGKFRYNLQEKGTILLATEQGEYRSVKVAMIFEFQDYKSNRWIPVRH